MVEKKSQWVHPGGFERPHESPGFVFWRDFMRWQRELNALLKPLGLTQPQYALLAVCGWMTRDADAVTQQDLVAFLGMDKMHISQVASRLERDGLIRRVTAAKDQRSKAIILTLAGEKKLGHATPIVESFDQAFFNGRAGDIS